MVGGGGRALGHPDQIARREPVLRDGDVGAVRHTRGTVSLVRRRVDRVFRKRVAGLSVRLRKVDIRRVAYELHRERIRSLPRRWSRW